MHAPAASSIPECLDRQTQTSNDDGMTMWNLHATEAPQRVVGTSSVSSERLRASRDDRSRGVPADPMDAIRRSLLPLSIDKPPISQAGRCRLLTAGCVVQRCTCTPRRTPGGCRNCSRAGGEARISRLRFNVITVSDQLRLCAARWPRASQAFAQIIEPRLPLRNYVRIEERHTTIAVEGRGSKEMNYLLFQSTGPRLCLSWLLADSAHILCNTTDRRFTRRGA